MDTFYKQSIDKARHVSKYIDIGIQIKTLKTLKQADIPQNNQKKIKEDIKNLTSSLIDNIHSFLTDYNFGALYLTQYRDFIKENCYEYLIYLFYTKIADCVKNAKEIEKIKISSEQDILDYVNSAMEDAFYFINNYDIEDEKLEQIKKELSEKAYYARVLYRDNNKKSKNLDNF